MAVNTGMKFVKTFERVIPISRTAAVKKMNEIDEGNIARKSRGRIASQER